MQLSPEQTWCRALLALATGVALSGSLVAAPPPPPIHPPTADGTRPARRPAPGVTPIVGDQEFVQIAPGYLLYAEKFVFWDSTYKRGRASGHVFIQLPPNFALLGVTFVHADSADFDVRMGWMVLRGWPEVLIGHTVHRAADDQTRMRLTWLGENRGLTTVGNETLETLMPGRIKGNVESDDSEN